jgi:hypothetical protein
VSRQRVRPLATDDESFPAPTVRLAAGPVWEREQIVEWAERTGRKIT